jgi:hypothetical protein
MAEGKKLFDWSLDGFCMQKERNSFGTQAIALVISLTLANILGPNIAECKSMELLKPSAKKLKPASAPDCLMSIRATGMKTI